MQVLHQNVIRFAEVKYYFMKIFGGTSKALAIISLYSLPDEYLLHRTYDTLCVCRYQGEEDIAVINAKSILSVVATVPFPFLVGGHSDQFFIIEQIGLDVVEAEYAVATIDGP